MRRYTINVAVADEAENTGNGFDLRDYVKDIHEAIRANMPAPANRAEDVLIWIKRGRGIGK